MSQESLILDPTGRPYAQEESLEKGWKKLPQEAPSRAPKTYMFDPMTLMYSLGYKDRRFSLTYDTIRQVTKQLALTGAIIKHRVNQVVQFCTPYRYTHRTTGVGFEIKHKSADRTMTASEKRFAKELEDWILFCGNPKPNRFSGGKRRPDFETFTKMFLRDLLELDQGCFEKVPTRSKVPYEIVPVDGATIRLAADDQRMNRQDRYLRDQAIGTMYNALGRRAFSPQYGARGRNFPGRITHVQVIRGQIETLYKENEMGFCIQNPRTDLIANGYGESNTELLIRVITAHLYAEQHNMNVFKQGSFPKGILNIVGENMDPIQMESFRRQWIAQLTGTENSWRTPVISGPDIQYIGFQNTNQEMEFNNWMNYLIRLECFPAGTPIVRYGGGASAIESIDPGDLVMTHAGRPQRVLNIQSKLLHAGKLVCLRAGGEVVRSTEEHPFFVAASHERRFREFDDPEWVKAGDITEGQDYLVVPKKTCGVYTQEFIYLPDYLDEEVQVKGDLIAPRANRVKWVKGAIPLDEDVAFVLGLYLAEGSVSGNAIVFTIGAHEKSLIPYIERFADRMRIGATRVCQKDTVARFDLCSVLYKRAFRAMFGQNAREKRVPSEVMRAPLAVQRAFLSGYFSGDGYTRKNSRQVYLEVATASEQVASQVRSMLLAQGVYAYRRLRENTLGYSADSDAVLHTIEVAGREAVKVSEWLQGYKGDTLRNTVAQQKGSGTSKVYETPSYFLVPVTEVWTEEFNGQVYNLEVERDNSYQVFGHYAAHNCAVWMIDPAEVGFELQTSQGQFSPPQYETPQEWKLKKSKDRGLRPLLRYYAYVLNREVVDKIDDHFYLDFVGLDELDQKDTIEILQQEATVYKTANEVRAQQGMEPLEDGDVILNPTYLQWKQMQMNQQMMEEQQQQEQAQAQDKEAQQTMQAAPTAPGGGGAPQPPQQLAQAPQGGGAPPMGKSLNALDVLDDPELRARLDHIQGYVEIET